MTFIVVADAANEGVGRPTFLPGSNGVYGSSLPLYGAAAAIVVDLDRVKTMARLTALLNALAGGVSYISLNLRNGVDWRLQSARTSSGAGVEVGPFTIWRESDAARSNMAMYSYQPTWTAADVAASRRNGPSLCGPFPAAILVDRERGFSGVASVGIAGVTSALTGVLA